jgi:glycosyltransferase involved in cell wall biosynthesis
MPSSGLTVAVCFGTFLPERNGGADFVVRFAAALVRSGARVHVVTSRGMGPEREEAAEGFVVHRIVDDWTFRGVAASRSRVRGMLEAERADVFHVFFPDSVVGRAYQSAAFLAPRRTRLVTTWWNLGLGRRSPPLLRLGSAALLARSRVLSSHDPSYLAALHRLVLGLKPVELLPVGSNFLPKDRRRRDGPFTLGFFGQLDFTRGVDTLFDALARLSRPEVRLVMLGSAGRPERYGGDPEFARLLALPSELGIDQQVEWTGFLSDEEIPQALADLDLCVLPYRRNSLGRSALAAALEAGTPVVLGGRADRVAPLVPGEHIALVSPDDPQGLADTLARLIDDDDERARLAAGARRAADLFAWPRIAETALDLYRRALR